MLADYFGCLVAVSLLLFVGCVVLVVVLVKRDKKPPVPVSSALGPMPGATGWFSDPQNRHELRYWDGHSWTAAVSDAGVQSQDPL